MRAFPFDSQIVGYDDDGLPIYDRASNAEEFARLLAAFWSDGVFGDGMCTVLADGSGLTATVGIGCCLIEGRYGYVPVPENVVFSAAGTQPRIDTVVLRRDLSNDVRNIVVAVVEGTPSANPVEPALTRDDTVWELGIANVLRPANSTVVTQPNVTDTRLDSARCGVVAAVMTKIDTTGLYTQIQSELASFKSVQEADFVLWFENLQTMLEDDVAANLAQQIAGKASAKPFTVLLPVEGWALESDGTYTQTAAVTGVQAADTLVVSAAPACHTAYCEAGVYGSAQGAGTLTFTAAQLPEASLTANVLAVR